MPRIWFRVGGGAPTTGVAGTSDRTMAHIVRSRTQGDCPVSNIESRSPNAPCSLPSVPPCLGMLAGGHGMPVRRNAGCLGALGAQPRRVQHFLVVKLRGRAVLPRRALVIARGLVVLAARRLHGIGH